MQTTRLKQNSSERTWQNLMKLQCHAECKILCPRSANKRVQVTRQGFLEEVGLRLVLKGHMTGLEMAETLSALWP